MSIRHYARMMVAIAAAYAVALQTILLAVGVPAASGTGFAAEPAALPICSSSGSGHSVPVNHDHDCLDACLAGCCGSALVAPLSVAVLIEAPQPAQLVAPAIESVLVLPFRAAGANRSRAPPLA